MQIVIIVCYPLQNQDLLEIQFIENHQYRKVLELFNIKMYQITS
jgi:hypothetical protein